MKSVLIIAILVVGAYSQGWAGLVQNATANCQVNCSNCLSNGLAASSSCLIPVAGLIQTGSAPTCTACTAATVAGVAACNYNGTLALSCINGYFLTTAGACTACGTGAATCTSATAATSCMTTTTAYTYASSACTVVGAGSTAVLFPSATGAATASSNPATALTCTQIDGNGNNICLSVSPSCANATQISSGTTACSGTVTTGMTGSCFFATGTTAGSATCVACNVGSFPAIVTSSYVTTCTTNPTTITLTQANGGASVATFGYIPWCNVYILGTSTTTASANTCYACAQGFVPSAAGQGLTANLIKAICIPCSTISATCPWVGTWAGYAWNSSVTPNAWVACTTASANASACYLTSTGIQVDTACLTGSQPLLTATGVKCTAYTTAPTDTNAVVFWNATWNSGLCKAGYYLPNITLSACTTGCSGCAIAVGNCSACATGYTLNATAFTCTSSTAAGANGTANASAHTGGLILSGLAFFSAILYYFI